MTSSDADMYGAFAVLAAFGAFFLMVVYCVALTVVIFQASSQCLAYGWPNSRVDYAFNRYCVKRVDQTDVVRPLSEVK